jgi:hypothetical protein
MGGYIRLFAGSFLRDAHLTSTAEEAEHREIKLKCI